MSQSDVAKVDGSVRKATMVYPVLRKTGRSEIQHWLSFNSYKFSPKDGWKGNGSGHAITHCLS